MKKDSRFLIIKILIEFDKSNKKLQVIRNDYFLKYNLESNTKARILAFTNDIIRLKGRLDFLISIISKREIKIINYNILSIFRLSFYEILYCDNIPEYATVSSAVNLTKIMLSKKASGFTNFILR